MQRRTVLQAGAASLAAPALSGMAQSPITLKFHTFMTSQSNVWLTMHKPWMDKVERESGGRIRFEAYPAMQLGGAPTNLYDQARDGVADIIWTLSGYTAGRFARSEVFELPFMMNNAEATSKAFWEYTQTLAAEEYKDTHLLAAHVHGPGVIHTQDRAIRTVADLRGLKLRGPSRQTTKMLGYLGAVPVGMPLPSIPEALSKGVVSGCVLPWEVIPSVRVHELARYHSEFDPAGGALYTATCVMTMNKKRYESLPADLRQVIDNNSGLTTSAWMGKTQQGNDPLGRKAAADRGNTIITVSAADAQEFRRTAAVVETEWVLDMNKRGLDGTALRDSARKLIAEHGRAAAPANTKKPRSTKPTKPNPA